MTPALRIQSRLVRVPDLSMRAHRGCVCPQARPAIASIFFGSYMGIVFFVLANMFIAIVTRHFEEVSGTPARSAVASRVTMRHAGADVHSGARRAAYR